MRLMQNMPIMEIGAVIDLVRKMVNDPKIPQESRETARRQLLNLKDAKAKGARRVSVTIGTSGINFTFDLI
ncbi:MAG: hypothetical protein KGH69_04165 [Candidatus Micrarchaeota archaeon]|nr:hypothetical protein [Candidatus Micrarchaeota archaeon]